MTIIPEPKEVTLKKGRFSIDGQHSIVVSPDLILTGELLQKEIRRLTKFRLNIEKIETPEKILKITKRTTDRHLFYNLNKLGEEGYIINISRDELTIMGNRPAGIFYGAQTLIQLLEDNLRPKSCLIRDWPDLKIRGVHFDLKGVMPKFEYLVEAIKRLSRYKLNTLLMEYEDKFKYDRHPVINSPVALTKKEIKELIKVAEEHYIQIIPLIECLGHVEYVLRHKEYKYVAEGKDELQQYCPLNAKTLQLYKDFCSEILALHKNTQYFHIGGGETRLLGKCKKCAQKTKRQGKEKLYVDYVKEVCRFIKEQGKIPILWDDMLSRGYQPELVRKLPKETIIMYWLYDPGTDKIPYLLWPGDGCNASQKWYIKNHGEWDSSIEKMVPPPHFGFIEDIPKSVMRIYEKYWDTKSFPMLVKAFPYTKFFKDRGYRVIGASAVRVSKDGPFFPDHILHIANIKQWAHQISKHNELGVVSTAWARSDSLAPPNAPFELCWYSLVASGEYYWSVEKGIGIKEFDQKFNRNFYEIDSSDIIDAMYLLNKTIHESYSQLALKKIEGVEKKIKRNRLNIEYLKLSARMLYHKFWREGVFRYIESIYYKIEKDKITDYELRQGLRYLKELKNTRKDLVKEVKKVLAKTMPALEIDEFIDSRYSLEKNRIEEYIKLFTEAREK